MPVHPASPPEDVVRAWDLALADAAIESSDAALIWRCGKPRPEGQQAASWRRDTVIDPEFDDDHEFIAMLTWANSDAIRPLRRVMIWTERTPEGLAGLLRHELEHTIQIAFDVELEHLHSPRVRGTRQARRDRQELNAIPMEVDANRAAARFLHRHFDADRLAQLVIARDENAACFRSMMEPESLDTLGGRMRTFIHDVMNVDDFVDRLEAGAPIT